VSALLESECADFEEVGRNATFAGEHGVHYTCRPDALARAVRNLIDNAIKYGGNAKVELRTHRQFVDIIVSDTGPGIPPDKIALAVEPFERLSKARESNDGGFGLGLAVAKAVAEGHDGELILAGNQPTGLVATLRLPKKE
jgi:signal transduction histidine kinase